MTLAIPAPPGALSTPPGVLSAPPGALSTPPGALPIQTATGGSPTVVALVFVALFVATVLSLYVAVRLYRGYRAGGGRGTLALGVGLVLLTTVPLVARLVLTNVPGVGPTTQSVVATASQLVGLLVILGVIYDPA